MITTPHLGASTAEAQVGVALEVAEAVLSVLRGHLVPTVVNAPMIPPETLANLAPYMDLAERLGRMAIQLVRDTGGPGRVRIVYKGKPGHDDTRLLRAAVIKGMLELISEQRINWVNADLIAEYRHLQIIEERRPAGGPWNDTITVCLENGATCEIEGTIVRQRPHVVRIGDFWIDLELSGHILLCQNQDRPGMIGQVGTILGREEVNISFMQVGRDRPRGNALMAIGLDEPPPEHVVEEIASLPNINSALLVRV
ncbi:MAG: ACT domain-containing protein [Ardenticatenia bacterium]|nr:ACT domain-containing protein [Ardenticatenia bacterium]